MPYALSIPFVRLVFFETNPAALTAGKFFNSGDENRPATIVTGRSSIPD
jgi:hypothetical protein